MIVNVLLYIILIIGLCLVFRKGLWNIWYKIMVSNQVKDSMGVDEQSTSDKVFESLYMMLQITLGVKSKGFVNVFLILSGLLGAFVLIIVSLMLSMKVGILAGLFTAALPFLVLRTKLQNFRVNISREGEVLVNEILNNYKINHYNMRDAIEETALTIEGAPYSKKILYDLSRKLNTASQASEIKASLDVFRYSIDTSWANVLSSNIYFAQVDGIKVANSLADLVDSIVKARKAMEGNKRENNEANVMLKFLFPAMYLLSIVGAVKFYGFTVKKFFYYQFFTETGATWFVGILALYVVSLLIASHLSRSKMDI